MITLGVDVIVDLEDIDRFGGISFYFDGRYVCHRETLKGKIKKYYLHRMILNSPKGVIVDHINHNVFDCRKCNLRICNKSQNSMNRKTLGVTLDKRTNKWIAQIKINYKNHYLGSFFNIKEAIKIRKEAEIKFFGEYAYNTTKI